MQYSVPQFVEVEDKIIGPLTIRQFLYVLGGVGVLFVIWTLAPSIELFLIPAVPVLGLFLAFAFYKVNGRPFIYFFMAGFKYFIQPKVRLWRRDFRVGDIKTNVRGGAEVRKKATVSEVGKKIMESRLKQLAHILDNERNIDYSTFEENGASGSSVDKAGVNEMTSEEREERVDELLGEK
ncbi:MAG: hypothetical protein ACD_63C00262G0002 [uncultured bacterium]|nr:MAG: hypothetical protein ACD_63C00262G0002 [uncultured bacterium]